MKDKTIAVHGGLEADKQNIKLEVVGDSLIVRGIKHLISAVIYNLCENAIKYNKKDGSVKISLKKKDVICVH